MAAKPTLQKGKSANFKHIFTERMPGSIDDFYETDKTRLGEGSYGMVKRGRKKETGEWRAIKQIDCEKVTDQKRFEEEIEIQQNLTHPNIVRLYEVYKDKKYIYLVMELCSGGELFDRIVEESEKHDGESAFDEKDAAAYMKQILEAINYLHSQDFVHRDIKPENFLLSERSNSEIKVIDFGLAKRHKSTDPPMKTKAGTPYYVAPQVLLGSYDEKCDIWSCGVIAYILMCGYPPFFGDKDEDILRRVKRGTYDFPESEWDHISGSAKDFIRDMLVMNPASRKSAEQLLSHNWLKMQTTKEKVSLPMGFGTRLKKFTKDSSMLKKVVLTIIAQTLDDGQIQELKKVFSSFDTNGDGTLTIEEMKKGIGKLEFSKPDELEDLMRSLDTDGSGSVDYAEFIAATFDTQKCIKDSKLWEVFRRFDLNGDGVITKGEMRKVMKEWSDEKATEVLSQVDTDGDGTISFEEFQHMMRS